jgi:hypothetical protein
MCASPARPGLRQLLGQHIVVQRVVVHAPHQLVDHFRQGRQVRDAGEDVCGAQLTGLHHTASCLCLSTRWNKGLVSPGWSACLNRWASISRSGARAGSFCDEQASLGDDEYGAVAVAAFITFSS